MGDDSHGPGNVSGVCKAASASHESHSRGSLEIVRISLTQANEHVAWWHRHNDEVTGHLWSVGLADDEAVLRAVMIVGRPISKALDDGDTVEVLRIAADGARNCNSRLYGAAARAAFAMGFHRVVTTIEKAEGGASLRAAGYRLVAERPKRKGYTVASARQPALPECRSPTVGGRRMTDPKTFSAAKRRLRLDLSRNDFVTVLWALEAVIENAKYDGGLSTVPDEIRLHERFNDQLRRFDHAR